MTDRPVQTQDPVAFFLTWTCYGTWLPGDERGWHRWGEAGVKPPDAIRREAAQARMKESAFLLSGDDRVVVESAVSLHCVHRGWTLYEVNARTNHVHVVVAAPDYSPEAIRDQLKAWCTRKLKLTHRERRRFWTEGASCRLIMQEADLESAILYAGDAQDRKSRTISTRQ